jgi:hypothetical protein
MSWQKANFHAHSKAWMGLTNGHFTADSVYGKYVGLGYTIPVVSNYQKLSVLPNKSAANYIPVYEHGYNNKKTHQLAIGATHVTYYDLPFYQTLDNKQYVLDHLGTSTELICINHPTIRNGYKEKELKLLTGYDLMEVLNRGRSYEQRWDIALSSGKPVWALGNDDSHDIARPWETGSSWTMINSETNNREDIYAALRKGRSYIVKGEKAVNKFYLEKAETIGDSVHFSFSGKAKEIRLTGQDGKVITSVKDVAEVGYKFKANDTYVRTAAYYGDFDILLNPVIRYDGKAIPSNPLTAQISPFKTLAIRSVIFLGWLITIFVFYGTSWLRRRKRTLKSK